VSQNQVFGCLFHRHFLGQHLHYELSGGSLHLVKTRAPIELFDPQNFIAFGIVIFYWLILPIYRIHHVRLAR